MAHDPKNSIFSKASWDRPAGAATGDTTPEPIFTAVGQALTQWELADQSLASLFSTFCDCRSPLSGIAVSRAYGSINGNAGRRTAVESAAEVYFSRTWDTERSALMGVINAVQWASVLRDDVAHGAVFKVNEQGHFHLPPDYNTKRTFALSAMPVAGAFTWAKYHYVAAQIVDISAKFTALRHAILDYEDDVIARSKDRTII